MFIGHGRSHGFSAFGVFQQERFEAAEINLQTIEECGHGPTRHDREVASKQHAVETGKHAVTATFPRHETYGLTSQMRRAASSIRSNIVEGGREGDAELSRFCLMARGSVSELEYQILLARDLNIIESRQHEQLTQQAVEIKRMLTVFVQKLNAER